MRILRLLLGIAFIVAGALHVVHPRPYVRIVPEWLPAPELLVAVSGAAEVLGGIGLLVPSARRGAALGLVALLVAVFPANLDMALHPERSGLDVPQWLLWARLPLQPALIGAVWCAAGRRSVS